MERVLTRFYYLCSVSFELYTLKLVRVIVLEYSKIPFHSFGSIDTLQF